MFRFTIRDVLWLMVVAMGAAWFMDRARSQVTANMLRAQVSELEAMAAALKEERQGLRALLWQTKHPGAAATPLNPPAASVGP